MTDVDGVSSTVLTERKARAAQSAVQQQNPQLAVKRVSAATRSRSKLRRASSSSVSSSVATGSKSSRCSSMRQRKGALLLMPADQQQQQLSE